jgi:hypothetical protein
LNLQRPDVNDHGKAVNQISNNQTSLRRQIFDNHADRVTVNLRDFGHDFKVMFVAEVEEKNIIGLTVDSSLDRIRGICDERREES